MAYGINMSLLSSAAKACYVISAGSGWLVGEAGALVTRKVWVCGREREGACGA